MYLKNIKAYGFKSFADKIEINFGQNINGIVGPNGSGKSNIADAVRWVLGEQSVKSLRADNSTDIIFSGSKSRKPLNSASVTLTFDNQDMYLPIHYNEVSVKRVMYKTGENEYFLNNEKCRLKDIHNLLADSGADKDSFNIISQGKIDEILSTKASDRRAIFESAARVVKYKKRKEEALKKLDRTNANISRVNDIITELERNVEPLRKQSEDAKKFLEWKKELTDVEISLAVEDIYQFNEEVQEIKEKIAKLSDNLVSISANNSSYDIDILDKKKKLKEIEEDINVKQNELLKFTTKIEKIDTNIKLLKERQKYALKRDDNVQKIIILKEEIFKLDSRIRTSEMEIQSIHEKIKNEEDKLETLRKKLDDFHNQKQKFNHQIDSNNRKLTNLKYQIDFLEHSISSGSKIPSAIKSIMDNPRMIHYHDVIGNLLQMDEKYTIAINTALGNSANYLVVDSSRDAKEMVTYLKNNNLGRATFYPIDVIQPRSVDLFTKQAIIDVHGYIEIANELVHYDKKYDNIIKNQLGNVIICDNIENANKISDLIHHKYRIVTLDGQVIHIGGSITGGSNTKQHNSISEKHELSKAKKDTISIQNSNDELTKENHALEKQIDTLEKQIYTSKTQIAMMKEEIKSKQGNLASFGEKKADLEQEMKDLNFINQDSIDVELEGLMNEFYHFIELKNQCHNHLAQDKTMREQLNEEIMEIEQLSKQSSNYILSYEKEIKNLEIRQNTINIQMDNLLLLLSEEYNTTYESAKKKYMLEIPVVEAREKVRKLKEEIKKIDFVNVGAIEEFERVNTRYEFLLKQRDDLKHAEVMLLEIIQEMDSIMKEKFLKTFEKIRVEFKKVFVSMFQGGEAELLLTDENNLLETGIEIQAVPSGKNLKSISLLSGGEKTFTAISLLFAILNVCPVPFCLLDEVEAALDDANVEAFGKYLNKYRDKTQFILITHKKKTMEFADILYGITMQESGVSKLVSVKLEDIERI